MAFGTSLTARGGWQTALEVALSARLRREVTVETIAQSGATSHWALEAVERVVAAGPEIVLVEFYANDAALRRFMTVGSSRQNMDRVLIRLKGGLPNARVIVMAMNPILGLRGMLRPFIDSYIDAHRLLAEEKELEFVDHRAVWLGMAPALRTAIPDGAHPLPDIAAAVIVPGLVQAIARGEGR